MKELSENDKAIDIVRQMVADGQVSQDVAEKYFPELAGSEDERIRKKLIEAVKGDMVVGGTKDKQLAIAWLEKQGENSLSHLFTFEDVLTIQCAMAYAKFQDRELDVALKKLHDKVYDAYHDSENHHIESQDGLKGEQKPAWSEEDDGDAWLNDIISKAECNLQLNKGEINWLKALKDKYTCKSSDEHYELEEFAKIVRCNLTGISKAVQNLFESKYLQLTGNKMFGGFKD